MIFKCSSRHIKIVKEKKPNITKIFYIVLDLVHSGSGIFCTTLVVWTSPNLNAQLPHVARGVTLMDNAALKDHEKRVS